MPDTPPVSVPASETHRLGSANVDQTFEISIGLPEGYARSDARYPVVYTLDGNGMFGMVTETARLLAMGLELPKVIVVGIGYPVGGFSREVLALRTRDYTPTERPDLAREPGTSDPDAPPIASGGAAAFLAFLRDELAPFVDARFRTDPADRTLLGDSFGGLFGLYALFHRPDAFERWVVGSPSIWWDDSVTLHYEEVFRKRAGELDARVFLSVGALEEPGPTEESAAARMVSNTRDLALRLAHPRYERIRLTTHVFPGETHLSVIPATVSRGLRAVFAPS